MEKIYEKNCINNILELIQNKVKIKDISLEFAGPFSYIGLNFNEEYTLRVEKNIIGKVSFWKKTVKKLEFFIKNIDTDTTTQISKDEFKLICDELKNIDTDTVNSFLNRSFCK